MSIAIMQPYLFPYIGYFQLVYATDVFVFYDDVNFINRGWINRNRILVSGKEQMLTIPCQDASQNRLIKDIEIATDVKAIQKLLSTVQMAYRKAPFFSQVYPIIEKTLDVQPGAMIARIAADSVMNVCNYLGLERVFKMSSEHYSNQELRKGDRLIDICLREGIVHYINPSGGKELYTQEYFEARGVRLNFSSPKSFVYRQFDNAFVPWLSIIDVLMFNSVEEIINNILPLYNLD